MRNVVRLAAVATFGVLALAGCGGGGGDSGGAGSGGTGSNGGGTGTAPPEAQIFVNTPKLAVTAGWGDYMPSRTVELTAAYIPTGGIFVGHKLEGDGVSGVNLTIQSSYLANVRVAFETPLDLPVGTYQATLTLYGCYDDQCAKQVKGSPIAVPVTYTVTSSEVSLLTPAIAVTASSGQVDPVLATVQVGVSRPPEASLKYLIHAGATSRFVRSVTNSTGGGSVVDLQLEMHRPSEQDVGTHAETIVVRVCYDESCAREVSGSPLSIALAYTATRYTPAEPGVAALPSSSRIPLSHDVIDAEYVRQLDLVAMVATYPDNALYLYDVVRGLEHRLPLTTAPTAVSVSADGRFAVVGHDRRITHVDLDSLVAGAPVTKLLDVSTKVFDLVLDGRGNVHVMPDAESGARSVAVATNVETAGHGYLYERSRARLHPSGDFLYVADSGIFPDDLIKFDVRGGDARHMYDSLYRGTYPMCGNVWFDPGGASIYTACGNAFRASTTQADDMAYVGRLPLTPTSYWPGTYRIQSLSQSDALREIVLLEEGTNECISPSLSAGCYSHFAVIGSDTFEHKALYSLPPIALDASTYSQRGLFVFHDSSGRRRFVISQVNGAYPGARPYYLSIVE